MAAEASDRGAVADGKYRSVPLQVVDDQVSHPTSHLFSYIRGKDELITVYCLCERLTLLGFLMYSIRV